MRTSTVKNDFTSKWGKHSKEGWKAGVFRVFPEHFLDFFIGYSSNGEREFVFKWVSTKIQPEINFELKHIEVVYDKIDDNSSLVLRLRNRELSDLFSIVCLDLAEATRIVHSPAAGVSVFFNRLRRWSELLSKSNAKQMSFQERLGLMGELCMIDWLTLETGTLVDSIIRGWRGPDGDTNDIGLNGARLEVKAQLSTQPIGIKVSSLTQLAEDGKCLLVVLHRFSAVDDGISLAGLVDVISERIGENGPILMDFQRKLILSGYDENESYANDAMILDKRITYKVSTDFPRLQLSTVPIGITNASYFIDGTVLNNFVIEASELGNIIDG
jgi:hypothetical protein